jgi:hypothetical protein
MSYIAGTLAKRYTLMYHGLEYVGFPEGNEINTSYISEE